MPEAHIRPALPQDATALRLCAKRAFAPYIPRIGRPPAPIDAPFEAQIAAGMIHVLQRDGAILGYLTCFPVEDLMHLETVALQPEAMGQGHGKALIGFCEESARSMGLRGVTLYTNAAMVENLQLYPRLGYLQTGSRLEDGFQRVFFQKIF